MTNENKDKDILEEARCYLSEVWRYNSLSYANDFIIKLTAEVERLRKEEILLGPTSKLLQKNREAPSPIKLLQDQIDSLTKERGELKDAVEAQRVGYLDSLKKLEEKLKESK